MDDDHDDYHDDDSDDDDDYDDIGFDDGIGFDHYKTWESIVISIHIILILTQILYLGQPATLLCYQHCLVLG